MNQHLPEEDFKRESGYELRVPHTTKRARYKEPAGPSVATTVNPGHDGWSAGDGAACPDVTTLWAEQGMPEDDSCSADT